MRLILCLLLVGCATEPEPRWVGSGNFAVDQGQCQAQAFSVAPPATMQAVMVYNACMRGKGWQLR